jgi:methylated-DNA-[protein]-cysteine S-methyltransferase
MKPANPWGTGNYEVFNRSKKIYQNSPYYNLSISCSFCSFFDCGQRIYLASFILIQKAYNDDMSSQYYYTIFKVRWGFFGICATENGVFRTCLPVKSKSLCQKLLTKDIANAVFKKSLLLPLQKSITSYYKCTYKSFKCTFDKTGLTPFTQKVLQACTKISYGRTITYKQLARLAGRPNAARAVGAVMARNRTPLLIPCHRILSSNNRLGGFSAPGGMKTKKKMLNLEKKPGT